MQQLSEDVLIKIVEAMASGAYSLADASRSQSVPLRTFWRWMQWSKEGDPRTLIHWPDEDAAPIQFIRAMSIARKMAALEARSRFEKKSVLGYYVRETRFQGNRVWLEDERCVGMDPDLRELLGYSRDGLLRDEFGRTIAATERVEMPAAMTLRYLSSFFHELREHSVSDQNVSLNGSLGVTHIKQPTGEDGPPQIAPPPPRPVVTDEALLAEPKVADDGDDELLKPVGDVKSTAPVADESFETQPPTPAPEPERVIREPAPEQYQPRATRALSALEQDLIDRLKASPEKRAAMPQIGSKASTLPRTPRP